MTVRITWTTGLFRAFAARVELATCRFSVRTAGGGFGVLSAERRGGPPTGGICTTGLIDFELREPEQPPLDDYPVYDPANAIMAIDGGSLEPKPLKELTTMVMVKGMHADDVCPAITHEPKSCFPNKAVVRVWKKSKT